VKNLESSWVDAIYVDHDSIPERNQQIKMMMTIDSDANRVTVYTGPEADKRDEALDFATFLDEYVTLRSNLPVDFRMTRRHGFPVIRLPAIRLPDPSDYNGRLLETCCCDHGHVELGLLKSSL
jgi:hypothetical protein